MISKPDWQNAYRDLIADGRKRVEPPTVEEVEALFRNELSETEAERVREQLSYYPDMARAMTDTQLAADLAAADGERPAAGAALGIFRKRSFFAPVYAIAAGLAVVLVLGGIYLMSRQGPPSQTVVTVLLEADGHKGGTAAQTPIQLSTGRPYLLEPLFRPDRTYADYRLELLDLEASPPRAVWARGGVRRKPNGSFPAEFSTAGITPGLYELVLYGVDSGRRERLAAYTIRFSAP
jgi:hypothetical protein